MLFPNMHDNLAGDRVTLDRRLTDLTHQLEACLHHLSPDDRQRVMDGMIRQLPSLKRELNNDVDAIYRGDPAAKGHEDVILAYPSLEAIMVYRVAHRLHQLGVPLLARMCASIAHRNTGIDIHPSAVIGSHFCIDHGTGIVIGETAVIGNHVKMYQGVTIGALSVSKDQVNKKRHPTIQDRVTIYARATILGGETVIGHDSIIGGNVWLIQSVSPNSKIYNKGVVL